VAIGDPNVATGIGAVAIGANNSAIGTGAVALGNASSATGDGSVAIGNGAIATRTGQVALGNSASTYTLSGVGSAASNAAQSGTLKLLTTDAAGNLGTSALDIATLGGLPNRVNLLEQQTAALDARTVVLERHAVQANGGIATAMAMGGTMIVPDSDVSVSFNLATYRGEQGFSGAAVVRLAPRVYVSGGIAGSTVKGSTGGRVGVAFGF
jgi:hypothetical protein